MPRADRMTTRLDTSLHTMARSIRLPARQEGERFRAYHLRVSAVWLEAQSLHHPAEALALRRLLARDARRRAVPADELK